MAENPNYGAARDRVRDKRRNRGRVAAAFRAASSRGEFPDLGFGFGDYFKLADAITDAAKEAKDEELNKFIDDCCNNGDGGGFALFEDKVGAKLQGDLRDLIMQLLPVLLPLLIGCFG